MATPARDTASKSKSTVRSLDPMDLLDVRGQLAEEEQLVRDSVARLVDEKVLPIIAECFETASLSA